MKMNSLTSVLPSNSKTKKYVATFMLKSGKEKKTSFGAKGYDDYTIKKDKEQRDRYRKRHEKDLKTGDPMRAGYLSFHLLWGNSTSLKQNIKDYKKRFKL